MKPVLKDLPELINANVINEETAEKIRSYYSLKLEKGQSRQQLALGILGSLLVGLGIILIIAHNWDELSRSVKTFLAFLPLVLGQLTGGYVLLKKPDKIIWKESLTTFLFFSVGACLALISQVYNISGELDSFVLSWMLLVLPIVYVFRASVTSLLYQTGITWFACLTGYGYGSSSGISLYWLCLLLIIPYYFYLVKYKREANFTAIHHWSLPLSLIIGLGTIAENNEFLMYLVYFCLFNLFYLTGKLQFFKGQSIFNNGYKNLGASGMLFMLFLLSYDWFWTELYNKQIAWSQLLTSTEYIVSVLLIILLLIFTYTLQKEKKWKEIDPLHLLFVPVTVIFIAGFFNFILPQILVNLLVIVWSFLMIRDGSKKSNLRYLNLGLLIISVLIICRFFDWNLSFVLRGITFIIVGVTFFLANFILIKHKKPAGINT